MSGTEDQCPYSLDGEHHYGPRKWLIGGDANVEGNWDSVIACRCRKRPDNEAEVREQLAATARERARQRELSRIEVRKVMEQSGKQFKEQQPKLEL